MRINKTFLKSSFIYTVAGALPMASAIILLPFYVTHLSTSDFGALSLYLAFAVFIQILATYSFDISLYIHFHEYKNDEKKLAAFVSSAFILMLIIGVGVMAVFTVSGDLIFRNVLSGKSISFYPYGIISTLTGIFQAMFKVHGNLLQTREKPETFLWANIVYFLLIAGVTIVGLELYPGSLLGPLGGRLLAGFVASIWVYNRVFREFGFQFRNPWKDIAFSFNAYAFLYQLQQWAINYIDRFLILFFLPLSQVGVYDFAIKCLAVIDLLLNGLNSAITPKIIQLVGKQTEKGSTPEMNRYYYGQLSVMMIVICFFIAAIPLCIDLFIPRSGYAGAIQYIPYLALLYVFRSMRLYFAVQYNILKKMDRITWISFIVTAIKIGMLIVLVPQWDLYGVVAAAFIASILEIIMLWFFLKNDFQFRYNWVKLIGAPALLIAVVLLSEPFLGTRYPLYLHVGYTILCLGVLWFAYRNEFKLLTTLKV
jgi:O-antigen/teichoic acid export membrane protein